MRRIGIDVGGTNTDAVLLEDDRIVHAAKTPTTPDVTAGIVTALGLLTTENRALAVDAVMIGTTHFTNAVVQRRDLTPVAALRIGLPASASLPPFVDWPEDLANLVRGEVFMVEGGHEYDGRPILPLDTLAVRQAAKRIRERGFGAVGIASVFSPLNPACEEEAARILQEECPALSITCSHQLGRIGLLERENATLLNACLVDLAGRTTRGFVEALERSGIRAPLYITQNDGTVLLAAPPSCRSARTRWSWTWAGRPRTSGLSVTGFRARPTMWWRWVECGRSSACPISSRSASAGAATWPRSLSPSGPSASATG
jgi:N-methylhydantoinase A/oxoprolinase/acetone carboxylase beta subunit